jgi:FtsP/CotA-like multicopper oxidase with cupredoxin domain
MNMNDTAMHSLGRALVVAAAALWAGCGGGAPLAPDGESALATQAAPASGATERAVELGECTKLQAPAGSKLVYHVYATGVQIYRWNGASWAFVAPEAVLSADAGGRSKVGTHYAGPTWESVSGSKVVGTVAERCTASATAIPWLSLTASGTGPGIFERVTFIQRVNTVGGLAPSTPGSATGAEVRVPYTAEYFFYRT